MKLIANIRCVGKPSVPKDVEGGLWFELRPPTYYRLWRWLTPWMPHDWSFERVPPPSPQPSPEKP